MSTPPEIRSPSLPTGAERVPFPIAVVVAAIEQRTSSVQIPAFLVRLEPIA